jgi:plastocyanin
MHSAALHIAPILAAAKSKTPFYVAGALLVAWALFVSLGLGLRRENFPGSITAQRAVMAITALLVIGAASTAVITSGGETKAHAAGASTQTSSAAGAPQTPAASTPSSTSTASTSTAATKPATGSAAPAKGAVTALSLSANPGGLLSYNTKTLTAKAGAVTITLTNSAPLEHNVTIAQGATVLGATPTFQGASKKLTLQLKPGSYTFYCSVPGHRQAGMEGTLKVS